MKRLAGSVAASIVLALALSGCTSGKPQRQENEAGSGSADQGQLAGGTLELVFDKTFDHLDPQRTYPFSAISFLSRTMTRTLTTYPVGEGNDSAQVVPDAATDTGAVSAQGKQWQFTLKDGLTWQDGRPVTCEDFRYGISRTFAQDVITGGPTYAIAYLDIPQDPDGSPAYKGPYASAGQELYDKAVTCDGNTITFHLKQPVADFNATLTMPAFAAIREDKDTGAGYDMKPFSNGPYMVQGETWNRNQGGVLVRNPHWEPSTDDVRKAYPDQIEVQLGTPSDTMAASMISDANPDALPYGSLLPSQFAQAESDPRISERSRKGDNGVVDYMSVNVKQIPDERVRQAISMAINKDNYVIATGGSAAGAPHDSILAPTIPGYESYDPFGTGSGGSVDKARDLLSEAGVQTPYPLTLSYPKGLTLDKAMSAIKDDLDAAGFDVRLNALGTDYYDVIANPAQTTQLVWVQSGADYASPMAVIPPIFDSRRNISDTYLGYDFGQYDDPRMNEAFDRTQQLTDATEQATQMAALGEQIMKTGAFVPLKIGRSYYVYGSNITGVLLSAWYAGKPDLAVVAVR